jgi:hypothetical protein
MRTHPLMIAALERQHSAELHTNAEHDRLARAIPTPPRVRPARGRRRTYFRRFRAITMRLI